MWFIVHSLACHILLTSAIARSRAGTTTQTSDISSATTNTLSAEEASNLFAEPRATPKPCPMKMLSVCCCCLASAIDEPQPVDDHYKGECSKVGTRDVCGSNYTGASGYVMYGLEGHPGRIGALCWTARCGAMCYVN
ncbi:hypothetical protein F4782DRAFT_294828 [Xylaria castorea]|nr:hypothetical protein F4782DRAFT_294828 [Xylaria castorea]